MDTVLHLSCSLLVGSHSLCLLHGLSKVRHQVAGATVQVQKSIRAFQIDGMSTDDEEPHQLLTIRKKSWAHQSQMQHNPNNSDHFSVSNLWIAIKFNGGKDIFKYDTGESHPFSAIPSPLPFPLPHHGILLILSAPARTCWARRDTGHKASARACGQRHRSGCCLV